VKTGVGRGLLLVYTIGVAILIYAALTNDTYQLPAKSITYAAHNEGVPFSPEVLDLVDKIVGHRTFCVMHFVSPDKFSAVSFHEHYAEYVRAKTALMSKLSIKLTIDSPVEIEKEARRLKELLPCIF
jgi:hypothetical protein